MDAGNEFIRLITLMNSYLPFFFFFYFSLTTFLQLGVYVRRQKENLAHPFHVKSTWQPPIQNSAALERYLEETKLVLASTVFHAPLDNISANERKAIGSLKRNSEINLKKADTGKLQSLLTKSRSPQLLRSQDLDQLSLSRLRRSGNDQ